MNDAERNAALAEAPEATLTPAELERLCSDLEQEAWHTYQLDQMFGELDALGALER